MRPFGTASREEAPVKSMRFAALFVASVALAPLALVGCDRTETASSPTSSSTPAADGSPSAGRPAVEAFVRALYAGQYTDDIGAQAPVWSARTKAFLVRADALAKKGDVGFFETDPICDCQDGEAQIKAMTTTLHGADRADVLVAYDFGGAEDRLLRKTYRLVRENGSWRIDDIVRDQTGTRPEPPLLESLNAWIAREQANSAGGQG